MRAITSLPNTETPDSDYPYGRLKNTVGANAGTRVNESMVGDWAQFFAKIMDEANITPNNLPDSEYTGFQLYQALLGVFGGMRRTIYEIGAWDMDATAIITVLNTIDITKVRGASFVILNDAQDQVYVNGANLSTGEVDASIGVAATGFVLGRKAGGQFDGTNFNDTGVNRGYIILETYEL
jgi:hypothetical protein